MIFKLIKESDLLIVIMKKKLVYIINADWYFNLHWKDRAIAASTDYDVFVICPSNDKKFIDDCKENNISFINFDLSRSGVNPINEIKSLLNLRSILKRLSPDVIHAVTIKPNLYTTLLFPKRSGVVLTFAGLGTLRTSSGFVGSAIMLLVKALLTRWNSHNRVKVLFENQEDLEFITSGLSVKREFCQRVYGAGVDLERYNVTEFRKLDSYYILFASRMLKDKGLQELVDAVITLNSKGIDCKLRVAGIIDSESPLSFTQSEIDTLAEIDCVEWLGERKDISHLISQSTLVCLPTRYGEGIPRILIEALSCGRPVVTSSYGGCKDICIDGKTGYIVSPDNIEEIVSALCKLITQPSLAKEFGLNGRKLVEDKFSNNLIIQQHLDLYSSLSKEQ